MGRALDGKRWQIAMIGGRRVHVKMSNIKLAGALDAEVVQWEAKSAVPLKGHDGPPSGAND